MTPGFKTLFEKSLEWDKRFAAAQAEIKELCDVIDPLRAGIRDALDAIAAELEPLERSCLCACPGTCVTIGYCPIYLDEILATIRKLKVEQK